MRLLFCFLAAASVWQKAAAPSAMDTRALQQAIAAFAGEVGLAAVDLWSGREIAINADTRFPTASAIKTAVMVEAYHQAADGTLTLEEQLTLTAADKVGGSGALNGMTDGLRLSIRDLVHLMIVLSDNTATNLLVNRLGTARILERLRSYGFEHTKIFRPTFRDGRPDVHPELEREFGLGMATPREMAQLMALIARGKVVNAGASAAMLATLRRQQDRAMIPRYLPPGLQVANKTGTDTEKLPDAQGRRGAIRTDAAIVTGDGIQYAIAVFVRRGDDTRTGVDNAGVLLGATLSRMVFEAFGGSAGR